MRAGARWWMRAGARWWMRAGARGRIVCAGMVAMALTAGSMPFSAAQHWHRHHVHHRPAWRHRAVAARDSGRGWSAAPLATADADGLRPGQYIWQGVAGSPAPVSMVIDLERQVAYVYQGYALVGITTVSTGRRGYATPAGVFPILQKQSWHRSNRYGDAPMPYMQRLTWSGVALHAGGVPGYRQSHGCIHLPHRFAVALYGITRVGQIVQIRRAMPLPHAALASAADRVPTTAEAVSLMVTTL